MRLQNTPPKGAGKSQGVTKTERLVQIVEGLGQDKVTFLPLGIRTSELAERAGVPRGSVQALLAASVDSGRLQCCKVTVPGSPPQNEYRKGTGVPIPEFQPLNTKRAGIARNTAHVRPASSMPPVDVSRPADKREPEVPVFLKSSSSTTPQPAVGNTGSVQSEPTSADERAVASSTETPGPQPERRGMGPASAKAPAGDVAGKLKLAIDDEGVLQMGDASDPARWVFTPKQTKQLGYFLRQTHDVWNPF
jgi:hypothetical protein